MYFVVTVLYCDRDCLFLQSSEHTSHAQPPGRWMEPSWDMQCPIMDQRSVFPDISNQSRFPVSLCGGDDRMWWGYVCMHEYVGMPPSWTLQGSAALTCSQSPDYRGGDISVLVSPLRRQRVPCWRRPRKLGICRDVLEELRVDRALSWLLPKRVLARRASGDPHRCVTIQR
jgi:hypothetical protein